MSKVCIAPSQLNGTITAPPSKSDVHRAIICAALSKGKCKVYPVALSNDIKATIRCIEALGATTKIEKDALYIDGSNILKTDTALLDCGESGSTLRFLIPIAGVGGVNATFTGSGLLPQRPIGIYSDTLPKSGVQCKTQGGLPLEISGKLRSGNFEIPGNVSSQFITGLLFALPLLEGDSKIIITSPLESKAYVDMTINCMAKFGVNVEKHNYGYFVKGNQHYTPQDYHTEGDWSQAAFFMVAGAISGDVTVDNVTDRSAQGDKKIAQLLHDFGAKVELHNNKVTVKQGKMKAIDIDASQIPDLVPILAVCATFAEGTTKIYNAQRLRIKECDRLKATTELINNLGGNIKELPDGLEITGVNTLTGGQVEGYNDHRIVMSACICATKVEGNIQCTDPHSINKSYPEFFNDYNMIGGKADVLLR